MDILLVLLDNIKREEKCAARCALAHSITWQSQLVQKPAGRR